MSSPPMQITLTIKVYAPATNDLAELDHFAESIRDEVASAVSGALDVILDDYEMGGGMSW